MHIFFLIVTFLLPLKPSANDLETLIFRDNENFCHQFSFNTEYEEWIHDDGILYKTRMDCSSAPQVAEEFLILIKERDSEKLQKDPIILESGVPSNIAALVTVVTTSLATQTGRYSNVNPLQLYKALRAEYFNIQLLIYSLGTNSPNLSTPQIDNSITRLIQSTGNINLIIKTLLKNNSVSYLKLPQQVFLKSFDKNFSAPNPNTNSIYIYPQKLKESADFILKRYSWKILGDENASTAEAKRLLLNFLRHVAQE